MLTVGHAARIANLLGTPVIAGLSMSALGAWRRRRGGVVLRLDRFMYAYVFALALAVIRYTFGSWPANVLYFVGKTL